MQHTQRPILFDSLAGNSLKRTPSKQLRGSTGPIAMGRHWNEESGRAGDGTRLSRGMMRASERDERGLSGKGWLQVTWSAAAIAARSRSSGKPEGRQVSLPWSHPVESKLVWVRMHEEVLQRRHHEATDSGWLGRLEGSHQLGYSLPLRLL